MNHFFLTYIQPITLWLHAHPNTALSITFLMALCESLIVIGTLIPGSFFMTALGILAGSGAMRIDLTMLAAISGAIAGDGMSYMIGAHCSDKIATYWPFNRYPNWLNYGKNYFQKHGGKSIIIGRFFGPLRSLIPVIAGMMHMERNHFLFANIISAIIWSVTYVVPGIIIGGVSSELSPENATDFFMLILASLLLIWLTSWFTRWIWIRCHKMWQNCCEIIWTHGLQHRYSQSFFRFLTPKNTSNSAQISGLLIGILLVITIFFILMRLPMSQINQPSYLFLQGIRTNNLDKIGSVIQLSMLPLTRLLIGLYVAGFAFYLKKNRLAFYWSTLWLISSSLAYTLHSLNGPLLSMTALLVFLNHVSRALPYLIATILLGLGLSALIITKSNLSDVGASYLIGVLLAHVTLLFYQRQSTHSPIKRHALWIGILSIISGMALINSATNYSTYLNNHKPIYRHHVISESRWWTNISTQLPFYITNHFGKNSGTLNIQYAGNICHLTHTLKQAGWKQQPSSFLYRLLMRASGRKSTTEFPLINPLYQERKPVITLTLKNPATKIQVIIRFWESGYHIEPSKKLIYLGSMVAYLDNHFESTDLSLLANLPGDQYKTRQEKIPPDNRHSQLMKIIER